MTVTAAQAALGAGYGGAIAGVAVGGVAGAATTGTGQGTAIGAVAGGIVGGIAETIANAAVKDVTYVAITDVQISERAREGVVGRRELEVDAQQGMGGSEQSTLPKRRRRSATAPGSSAPPTRSIWSTKMRRHCSMRG